MVTYPRFVSPFVLLLCFIGCQGEDSWRHYSGGGMYVTASPSMSPDGTTIVFSSPRTGNGDIYSIDRQGSRRVRLTNSPCFEADPMFSPNGDTIAFVRESGGCRHVWLMDKNGSNQRQVTFGRFLDDLDSFSPNGSTLLISRSRLSLGLGKEQIPYALHLRREALEELKGSDYCYSPDGTRLAYSRLNEAARRYEVWLMDADGSNKRFLAVGQVLQFSSDGRILCAVFSRPDIKSPGSEWRIVNADGSQAHEIGRCINPIFTADGSHIVYFSPEYRASAWKMRLDGSDRERLDVPPGNVSNLRSCRDGFIFRLTSGADRVGDIWVIKTKDWTTHLVASMQ